MKKRFAVACVPYEMDGDKIGDYLGGIIMFDIPFEVTGDSLIALEDLTLSIALKKTAKKFIKTGAADTPCFSHGEEPPFLLFC